jgi:hypothetical protein
LQPELRRLVMERKKRPQMPAGRFFLRVPEGWTVWLRSQLSQTVHVP